LFTRVKNQRGQFLVEKNKHLRISRARTVELRIFKFEREPYTACMKKILENKMNPISRMTRLFVALTFVAGFAGGASAQTMGNTLASYNILANNSITLTGAGAAPLIVNRVGTSPGITLTTTDATVGTYDANNATAKKGKLQGQALWDSMVNAVGANPNEVMATNTLTPLIPQAGGALGAGITLVKAPVGNNITDTGSVTITGPANAIVIFQVDTFVALTNFDVVLAGGITPSNIFWQVGTGVTIINNDATVRNMPGTFVNNTAAQDIALTVSAGGLHMGRYVSLQGSVSVTKSAGTLAFDLPVNGPGVSGCTDGNFYPSPATGATGTFAYCMEYAGDVKIRVYNAIGDLAVKIDDIKSAGSQESTIDTGKLAPGVYLYVLERKYNGGSIARSKVKKFAVQH
jgi:hypothetical protein